ncbi:MAG: virulence RhuM family protein [Sulfuricella sp.]
MKQQREPQILLYQTDDGTTRVEVRMAGETVWLNQNQMADLFLTTKQNVGQHIRNVFAEGELAPESVVKDFFTTAADGKQYRTKHYSLDVIISVGYRVKSHRGTQFRIWSTQQLRSYLVKGFALDDRRLKEGGSTDRYFDELLERIRDIRTSERMFYRKIADIYATSIDYDPASDMTRDFYATVQNKFHFAITGQTAAELIAKRADVDKPNMGLTNWPGSRLIRKDVTVAKNYLSEDELGLLNLIVDQYLSFAEAQARQKKVMSMTAWIDKLHAFLELNEKEILQGAGKVSKQLADELALREYDKFQEQRRLAGELDDSLDRALGKVENEVKMIAKLPGSKGKKR